MKLKFKVGKTYPYSSMHILLSKLEVSPPKPHCGLLHSPHCHVLTTVDKLRWMMVWRYRRLEAGGSRQVRSLIEMKSPDQGRGLRDGEETNCLNDCLEGKSL